MLDTDTSSIHICLFGIPQISRGSEPLHINRRKALALLACLATADQPVSRTTLAVLLSPDFDTERSNAELRRALATLKEIGLGDYVISNRDAIILERREALWIDVQQFDDLLKQSWTISTLQAAVDLYRDDFMKGFVLRGSDTFDEWHLTQTQTYQQKFTAALEKLVQMYIEQKAYETAIPLLERWLAIDRFDEQAHTQAMRLYAMSGQKLAAQRVYENYALRLQEEMGSLPQQETTQLYEDIKAERFLGFQSLQPVIIGKLPPVPPLVLGREQAVADLKSLLGVDGKTGEGPVVIQGWPGIGKTTLSAMLAHDAQIHATYPDGVLWVSLGQHPNLLAELKTWADAVQLPFTEDMNTVEKISARLTAALKDKKMLLIVDDVWDVSDFTPFQVASNQSAMLVSTRANDIAQRIAVTPSRLYKLPILSEERSLELLQLLAHEAVEQNLDAVRELIRDLEGLPLALQVAGRLLRAEHSLGWGVEELLTELREGARLLEAQPPADRAEFVQDTSPTIAALLRRSTDRLDPDTRAYFALLGVFAPKPATFDLAALEAVWEVEDPKPTVRILVNRGLMEPVGNGDFQVHALLVAHARSLFSLS